MNLLSDANDHHINVPDLKKFCDEFSLLMQNTTEQGSLFNKFSK